MDCSLVSINFTKQNNNIHPNSSHRYRKHCEEMSWEWIGICWFEQHIRFVKKKKWHAQLIGPQISVFSKDTALSLSFAIFLHTALLHNKYQIINRALDAFLWYCEPKHHTRAFALPVVQWCHFLFMNNSLIRSRVLWSSCCMRSPKSVWVLTWTK